MIGGEYPAYCIRKYPADNRVGTPAQSELRSSIQGSRSGRASVALRLLFLCPLASLVAAAALFWLFGFNAWAAILGAVLLGCPVAVIWTWWAARQELRRHQYDQ
jgi:hypothetical protein